VSGVHGGVNWALPFNQIVFSVQGNHATLPSVPAKFPCIPRDFRHSHIHPGLLVTDGVFDGNSAVSRRQQITFRATLIFHLIDGLLSTTAAHEVRRAGVLTCKSCHLERSARPHPHRG